MRIIKPMHADDDGFPSRGRASVRLGVRIRTSARPGDIQVWLGRVWPHTGGISVTMDDPRLLPVHLRPAEIDHGEGHYPVFAMEDEDLPEGLHVVPDDEQPEQQEGHAVLEPRWNMPIETHEALIEATGRAGESYCEREYTNGASDEGREREGVSSLRSDDPLGALFTETRRLITEDGWSREELLDAFRGVRVYLEKDGEVEAEDTLVDVMNVLSGWSNSRDLALLHKPVRQRLDY